MKPSNDNSAHIPDAAEVARDAEAEQDQNAADPFAPEGDDENLLTDAPSKDHDLSEADRLKATEAIVSHAPDK